ncbi:mandelate racemase/muconate lactonizing enzyme family protein [Lignipirellula cremea]|uniref:L-Ala-D/L-Glu epimerase n=1 Tax=Lignipirellula cremea TaxID=2528010 RepID=A0A518E330_9BACT|nr:mandelate racemase/muconate lactonizing enzyme family protein [Lignipirellula cremea]QDU98497.1 L-Ala-D/L-Glu epimerase [Lignipirellula cremea]
MIPHRRRFLQHALATTAVAGLSAWSRQSLRAEGSALSDKHFEVVDVKRTTARLEYRPTPRRNMDRELPHWRYVEICDVTLRSGRQGSGETLLYYTWGVPSEASVRRVIGGNAVDLMWDDSLGAGLQMALFDAVGRTAGVPVHALLGPQAHSRTPLSWWNIDTSAADMAEECRRAYNIGYRSYKTKGRPWFDVFEQLRQAVQVVPESFKIDMDFNDTLRDAERGLPILQELAKHPQVDIYETPIPQVDLAGNARITAGTDVQIAMHYGNPGPLDVIRTRCCDGFVVGGGAARVMREGQFCDETNMPFWLQLVGSGITAAFSLHFGGALRQAVWPAVNCHQLFEHDLLAQPILLRNGLAAVPDSPGLGIEIDRDELARRKVVRPARRPEPARLIETTWPGRRRMLTASNGKVNFMLQAGNEERYGYYLPGAESRLVENDGSDRWRRLYDQARTQGPIEV